VSPPTKVNDGSGVNRERNRRLEALFDAAIELSSAERMSFLDRECASDAGLRRELEMLLAMAPTLPPNSATSTYPPSDARYSAVASTRKMAIAPAPGRGVNLDPGTSIHQYELIRQLGSGGMGSVYLARDTRLGRRVAIKFLQQSDSSLSERFLREARATARCNHENIVVIHEVGEHDGRPYMVLEYLEGQTLRQWMREHVAAASMSGPHVSVPPGRVVELMLPVVRALAYAHGRGIVHRDLKPENVVLTRSGTIKVLDFGIAKLLSAPVQHEGPTAIGRTVPAAVHNSALIGTLPYMSPEQMKMGAIDHRSDLWAAGIILFELVTGQHPVPSRAMDELVRVASEDEPMPSVRERIPDLGPLAAIIDRCLIKNPQHRTPSARVLLAELESLAPRRGAMLVGDDGSPFAGLAAFQEGDADRFFGRDRDIDYIVTMLRSRPLVAVVGPSGAGKSSVIRAGVIPALKRSGEGWDAYVVRPGRAPLTALARMLAQIPNTARTSTGDFESSPVPKDSAVRAVLRPVIRRLSAEPGYLGARLRARAEAKLRRILIFVDQLEELYTLGGPAGERRAFLSSLAAAADDAVSPVRVVVSMRSDFLDRLTEDRHLSAEVTRGLVLLPPMGRKGLREALSRPVALCEFRFDPPGLVDRMVDALDATPGALPLLQFTAARLWELRDRDRRLLTEASYEQLGGVAGALASHADAVLTGMPARDARLARAVFLRLVTPERTRGLATLSELCQLGQKPEDMDRVLARLVEARLLTVDIDVRDVDASSGPREDGVVEIAHESLMDTWPPLARWLDENEADAVFLTRLRSAATDWERSGRAAGLLWTGDTAQEARAWQQRYEGELAPVEKRYLAAVLAAAERSRRTQRRLFGGVLLAAVVVAMAMGWLAWQESEAREAATKAARRAEQEAVRAEREAVRARDATRMAVIQALSSDPTTQLALLREIEDTAAPPPEATRAVKRLLYAGVASAVLAGHELDVRSASFSPDGARIVSASLDKTVRVWRVDGMGEPLVLRGHDEAVSSASFSPDGTRIVSASLDKTVRVWRADGEEEPLVLRGHDDAILSASFSPDGARIVSASRDKTVMVWRADGTGEPLVLRGHDDIVVAASFSPDGARIVSASLDKTVRVWRADGAGEPLVLRGHDDIVVAASFSPDGARIVSASLDRTVRVWRSDGAGEPLVLRGHDDGVWSASFSPDGSRIVSGSEDKTLRMWRADGAGEPLVLRGHDDGIWSASFNPDGTRVVSASLDKTVRVWRADGTAEPLVLSNGDDSVQRASFSPDGTRIVEPSENGTVRVRRSDGAGEPLVLRGHDDGVWSASFSPDGMYIVSASPDKTVRVWRTDATSEPLVLRGHDDMVMSASFSPDGARIVSASKDKTVRVWRADGTEQPLVLRGHDAGVWSASFSPDGAHVVSASSDKTVRVWRADGAGEPLVLRGHDDSVMSVSFSPDGTRIVSASFDNTIRVWRADGTGEPLVLRGHDDRVTWAEFSPDGTQIVSASKDKTIRIWRADGTGEPTVLTGHTSWVNAVRFSPDGQRIVSASQDKTVRVWRDLAAVTLDDPRLWTATTYCMQVERRVELLGVTEEAAEHDRQRCLERVAQARSGASRDPL
jgi:WD40 repeat protein/serine/threonine protein kinase